MQPRHTSRYTPKLAALWVVGTLLAGCGADPGESVFEEAAAVRGLAGSISVDGSSTVAPVTDAVAEEYHAVEPGVTVNIGVSGTGGGFERFCRGETHISNASRPIEAEEVELCTRNGVQFVEIRVGTDALTMVTSPGTSHLDCLTRDQVETIWGPRAARIWSEVDPDFPAEPISIFAPGSDSGTYDFLNEVVLGDDVEPRQDYNASEDDNIIVQGVAGTPNAWGYFGYAYLLQNEGRVQAIAYDAGQGCVLPSVETAQDGTYGLSRPLFVYVRRDALRQEHVGAFVDFYLDTVGEVIEEVGYIPVPQETLAEARRLVEEATAGS